MGNNIKQFKIEIRETCKICGKLITGKRFRTYCSAKCRNKSTYKKTKEYNRQWQLDKRGKFKEGKIQCKICGKWYWQLGSHAYNFHKITAREYRERFGYDVKTGKSILAKHLHELYGKQALENGTYKNLKKGEKHWFVEGDEKAGKYERSEETKARLRNQFKNKIKII